MNINEAMEVWLWDLHSTGIQVRWKAHQSADSNAIIQIMCCPNLFNKDGLSKEIVYSLKEVELKMIRKGGISADLTNKPIPSLFVTWCQSSQGRARNKNKKLLSLNNLPSFVQDGCSVLTIKQRKHMGAARTALEDAQQDGLILLDLWLVDGDGRPVWWEIYSVRLQYHTEATSV